MKKAFLLLCTLLLVLGSLLPLAGYRLAKAVLGEAAASSEVPASSALPAPGGSLPARTQALQRLPAFTGDAEVFLIEDQSTGEVQQVPRRDYLIGAVAAEMPLSWPDEALKAQGRCGPQLCSLLPRPRHSRQRSLALRRPCTAAGLPDRRRPPQLLGHPLRCQLHPSLRPCGQRPDPGALL